MHVALARTNIDIDQELIRRVMDAYSFESMRGAIDFALRELLEPDQREWLELEGMGWEGDLAVLRGKKRPEAP
jgi:Arc/MetJ family transcription regulator